MESISPVKSSNSDLLWQSKLELVDNSSKVVSQLLNLPKVNNTQMESTLANSVTKFNNVDSTVERYFIFKQPREFILFIIKNQTTNRIYFKAFERIERYVKGGR